MLRLVEITLFLSPFAAFIAWRMLLPYGGPSRRAQALAAASLAVLAGTLIWMSHDNTLAPGTPYVPPHVENGVIVPGHGAAP
jgi:hypothetical protein